LLEDAENVLIDAVGLLKWQRLGLSSGTFVNAR